MHLALLTVQRGEQVAIGALGPRRLYDVRVYKSTFALYAQLQRLAHVGKSGTFATSMPQLVAGAAAARPGWSMGEDRIENRDLHHSQTRVWLNTLEAMGLLTWRAGENIDGEEARTEITLLPAPSIDTDQQRAAKAKLAAWRRRYGRNLNTGSKTGVRSVHTHHAPVTAGEARKRAKTRARARWMSMHSESNPAPPFGSPASLGSSPVAASSRVVLGSFAGVSLDSDVDEFSSVSSSTTGARARASAHDRAGNSPGFTRLSHNEGPGLSAAHEARRNSLREDGGSEQPGELPETRGLTFEQRMAEIVARVEAKEAELAPIRAAVAAQIEKRLRNLKAWPEERQQLPVAGLREAWRASVASPEWVASTGPGDPSSHITTEDLQRLTRARARYARHAEHRPDTLPANSLGALLELATNAATRDAAAGRTLKGAIWALDRLSRRMRAAASVDDPQRLAGQQKRAQRRRQVDPAPRIDFRRQTSDGARAWPRWLLLDPDGKPRLEHHPWHGWQLVVDEDGFAPSKFSEHYRQTARDAFLAAGLPLPAQLDGRKIMHQRETGWAQPSSWENARRRGEDYDAQDARLAARAGMGLRAVQQLDPAIKAEVLAELDRQDREREAATRQAFYRRQADAREQPKS